MTYLVYEENISPSAALLVEGTRSGVTSRASEIDGSTIRLLFRSRTPSETSVTSWLLTRPGNVPRSCRVSSATPSIVDACECRKSEPARDPRPPAKKSKDPVQDQRGRTLRTRHQALQGRKTRMPPRSTSMPCLPNRDDRKKYERDIARMLLVDPHRPREARCSRGSSRCLRSFANVIRSSLSRSTRH